MRIAALILSASVIAAAGVVFAVARWLGNDGVAITTNGLLALGAGTFLTLALGMGLMALVFHSARSGHDDRVE